MLSFTLVETSVIHSLVWLELPTNNPRERS